VRFLWAEGVISAEIHRRILAQYGARTMSLLSVRRWLFFRPLFVDYVALIKSYLI
jgi:hypothetical protein